MRRTRWLAFFGVALLLACVRDARANDAAAPGGVADGPRPVLPLWPGTAPGSEGWAQTEVEYATKKDHKAMVRNVTLPTLTVYLPEAGKANGTAVVVAPGGGFRFLSWQNEGTAVARWLADRGVAAFVLKYRLLDTGASQEDFEKGKKPATAPASHPAASPATRPAVEAAPLDIAALAAEDGRQAVRVVRRHAAEWKIAPDRVGLLGFSAGGVVTMGVVLQHDAQSRPDFAAPIYGATPAGTVPADAPPLFILCAGDDKFAAAASVKLYADWKLAGGAAELHVYSKGGHGFGMAQRGLPVDHWIDRFGDWLDAQGLMKPPTGARP